MKERIAIDIIVDQPDVEAPWEVARFFPKEARKIYFAGNQASFGEDYGTVEDLRVAVEWFARQLGGKVKWRKKNAQ